MKFLVLGCFIRYIVIYLLLYAANLLSGRHSRCWRCTAGAGIFWGVSFLCGMFSVDGVPGVLCYLLGLCLSALAAFGMQKKALMIYILLSLAVDASAVGLNRYPFLSIAVLCLACAVIFQFRQEDRELVAVEFGKNNSNLALMALYDTGNQLRDPVTGKSVLVVDAKAAQRLTGLSVNQLSDPIGTMGAIPGLRLIPYKTVGNSGFLLGMRFYNVRIGKKTDSPLVAFSPQFMEGNFQALLGGAV